MKKKLIYIIIFILLLLIGLTIYKYKVYEKDEKRHFFTLLEPANVKKPVKVSEEKDKDTYKDSIITEDLLEIEYTLLSERKSILGKIYIDKNKDLYITDEVNKKTIKPSNYKFRTMFKKDYPYVDGIFVFLITEDNYLYCLSITDSDIKKATVKQVFMPGKIYNFTNLEYTLDVFPNSNSLFVLADNGNIYDTASLIRYREDIISMYDDFYVFSDKTMANVFGYEFQDEEQKPYKIKYSFHTYENNKFSGSNTKLIITENNDLLYEKDNAEVINVFNKKVKDIQFSETEVAKKGELTITFEDNYKVKLDATCNKYFCVNNIEE